MIDNSSNKKTSEKAGPGLQTKPSSSPQPPHHAHTAPRRASDGCLLPPRAPAGPRRPSVQLPGRGGGGGGDVVPAHTLLRYQSVCPDLYSQEDLAVVAEDDCQLTNVVQ